MALGPMEQGVTSFDDYSHVVDVKSYTTSTNRYTALYNGYLYVRAASGTNAVVQSYPFWQTVPANTDMGIYIRKGISFNITGSPNVANFTEDRSE